MAKVSRFGLAAGLLWAAAAHASDQPLYQPPADWVEPIAIPMDAKPSGAAADVLLFTTQDRLEPGEDAAFIERAIRINAPEGLQQAGSLTQVWNPLTDTLAIHRARILRGGKVIDLLADGRRFTVLRRETNLEAAMIDGQLTATLQPEGLQVGDVLDVAITLTRREPALAGHSMSGALVGHAGVINRLAVRARWPDASPVRIWKTDDLPTLTPRRKGGWSEIALDQTDAVSPEPPNGAPIYDRLFGLLVLSDFKDWKGVSAAFWPLYDKAATLPAASPLHQEIARIRALGPDPKVRALAALKLVEGQTRYLLVSLDAGGLTPASADQTWARRFGDCKGKTALLLALLHGLDIQAEPVLVNTKVGEALDREPPSMGAFDHVLVRAEIDGRPYWLDGTRMGDENLDVIPTPNDHWALPLRREGADLEPVGPKPPVLPYVDTLVKVDARAGLDTPAKVHEEITLRGDAALFFNLALHQLSPVDGDKVLRQTLTSDRSWIAPDKVAFAYDPQKMQAVLTLDGSGSPPFSASSGASTGVTEWVPDGLTIGFTPDFTRPSPYHRDAPFAVDYPAFTRTLVQVDLPDRGRGFELVNDDAVDKIAAGVAYSRAAALTGGRAILSASSRAVASSVSVADAKASEPALRGMADYTTFIRYTPPAKSAPAPAGPASVAVAAADPATAAAAAFQKGDYAAAERGFTTALQAGPSAKLYYDRAAARAAQGDDGAAEADLMAALKLEPHHALSLFALGRLAMAKGEGAVAARRFAEAVQARPDLAASVAEAYEGADQGLAAAPYWDRVAADAVSPAVKSRALNSGCWGRAVANAELPAALRDCDQALALTPKSADALDSRGLVDLRLGENAKAVADYTAALEVRSAAPTSLYGRGLAEERLGHVEQGQADLKQARTLDAKVDAGFAKWGLSR